MPAESIDGVLQPFFAAAFPLEFFPLGQTPQTLDQHAPVDQESPAGLVAAEPVQQFDGLPAPQSEPAFLETFDAPVVDRAIIWRCFSR